MEGTPTPRYASIPNAARYADVSTRTVYRWITAGQLTRYTAGAQLVRVDLNEVDRILVPTAQAR